MRVADGRASIRVVPMIVSSQLHAISHSMPLLHNHRDFVRIAEVDSRTPIRTDAPVKALKQRWDFGVRFPLSCKASFHSAAGSHRTTPCSGTNNSSPASPSKRSNGPTDNNGSSSFKPLRKSNAMG